MDGAASLDVVDAAYDAVDVDMDIIDNLTDAEYYDFIETILWPSLLEQCFVVIFGLMMVIGIVGNTLVAFIVISKKNMRSSMNIFLTNLACSDLLVLIFCLPPTVLNDVTKTFWFSRWACKSIIFLQNSSVYVCIITLVCISVERWRAITFPLKGPLRWTRYIIVLIWVVSMALAFPEPVTLDLVGPNITREYRPNFTTTWGTQCRETWGKDVNRYYTIVQVVCFFVLPLTLITVLYAHMSYTLHSTQLRLGKRQIATRRKAMRLLGAVVLIFAISYFPVHVYNIASAFDLLDVDMDLNIIALRKLIPRLLSYSPSIINPVLYNFMSEKFRKEFSRLCTMCRTHGDTAALTTAEMSDRTATRCHCHGSTVGIQDAVESLKRSRTLSYRTNRSVCNNGMSHRARLLGHEQICAKEMLSSISSLPM